MGEQQGGRRAHSDVMQEQLTNPNKREREEGGKMRQRVGERG